MATISTENLAALREAFIQKNVEKWQALMAKKDSKTSGALFAGFSIPAALFGFIWLAYRKVYRHPVALIVALILLVAWVALPYELTNILSIPYLLGFGFGGPHWYWLTTNREINQAMSTAGGDLEKAKSILRNRGGVSVLALIITIIIGIGLLFVLVQGENLSSNFAAISGIKEKCPLTGNGDIETESLYCDYYKNGRLKAEVSRKNGNKVGLAKGYYESGALEREIYFKNDKEEGPAKHYYENGALKSKFTYKDGRREGPAKAYHENGKVANETLFKNDESVHGQSKNYDENGNLTKTY